MEGQNSWTSDRFFGRLNYFLELKGWSMNKLTVETGISESALYSCRKRNSIPTVFIICKLCDSLDITIGEFFNDETQDDSKLERKFYLAMLKLIEEHSKVF